MPVKPPPLSEAEFQKTVVGTMRALGWAHMHVRRSRGKGRQWQTTTSAIGWPDVIAVRGEWLLAVELKSDAGKLTDEQVVWLSRFAQLPCARTWVLRPKDPWEPIVAWMQHPSTAPAYFGWPFDVGSIGDRPDWTLSSFEDGKPSVPGQTASS